MRLKGCSAWLLLFSGIGWAAEGDLELEVMARTGDATNGPGGKAFTCLELYSNLARRSIGMAEDGRIYFTAEFEEGGETEGGLYFAEVSGGLGTIAESGGPVPGVVVRGGGVFATDSPWGAMTVSESGDYQVVGMRSNFFNQDESFRFDQAFVSQANHRVIGSSPFVWSREGDFTENGNFSEPLTISDQRGETVDYFHGGGGAAFVVSDQGTVCWETKTGTFSEVIKSNAAGEVSAVVLKNTPAPGFSTEDNANFSERNRLLGIDDQERVYFLSLVDTTGGRVGVIYRQDPTSGILTAMFVGGTTLLPWSGANPLTGTVSAEDVHVAPGGELFLRVGFTSEFTGFWKVLPDGTVVLLQTISTFDTIPTNQGGVRLRGVGDADADWAVGNDDVIYFTAAVRLQGSGSDQGVWKIDPATGVFTTLGRKPVDGEFGDAPGTDATYDSFSNLTVCGDYVAFLAELSDETIGIFGTDTNGGVIKIAQEGDSLDGSVVTDLYFSPDTAGESLRETQGMKGLNSIGELAFIADLANDEQALVRASFEGNRIVSDPIYVWDGGAGNNDWHGVTNGRSNWVDGSGAPRAEPPPFGGPAIVTIDEAVSVRVFGEAVDVTELNVLKGSLEVEVDFSTILMKVEEEASLILEEGGFSATDLTITGLLLKETEGEATLTSDLIRMTGASFSVDGGTLKVDAVEAVIEDTEPAVESGELILKGGWDFQSEEVSIVVDGLGGRLVIESGVISIAKNLEVVTTNNSNVVIWGEPFTVGVLEFRAVNGSILTLKGEGNQWLRKPTVIPFELSVKVLLGGPLKSNDFVVDLGVNERLLIGGKLENFGETNINGGGIREVGGTFLNHGLLGIPFLSVGHLDVTSLGEVRQKADVRYGRISLLPGSRYNISGAELLPSGTGLRALDFQAGSKFTASGLGTSRVEGLDGSLNHFGSDLDVFGGAALELKGLNSKSLPQPGREFVYRIHKMGSLLLDGYDFRFCKIVGEGKVSMMNAIVGAAGSAMSLEVAEVDLTGMNLQREFLGEGLLELRLGKSLGNLLTPGNQIVRMDTSELGENTKTTAGFGSKLDVVGPLTLDGTLDIIGLCSLRADVSGKLASTGKLIISNSSNDLFPFLGRLTVPRDTQNVTIGVGVEFKPSINSLSYGRIIVERNASLVFADGVADSFFVNGKLTQGFWLVQAGASCVLKDNMGHSEIDVIGQNVKVTIEGSETPGRIADLPSPTHSLFVEGELELRWSTLDMNGQTLWNRKNVTGTGATIIGEVQSIRGDVQGVIQLSGDIRIEGNLTTDGVISMGASPGAGQVTGDLTLLPGSEMIVEFEGTEAGTGFDFMDVGGTINLDGKLTLKTLDDYVPPIDQGYRIISATEVTGAFAEIEQSEVGRTRRFEVLTDDLGVNAVAQELVLADFDDWRAAFFSVGELADPLVSAAAADPDGDGKDNLYEYVTNGLPKQADSEPFQMENGQVLLTWANGVTDYRWQLETSVGLEVWEPADAFGVPQMTGPDETLLEMVVGTALSNSPERYYQLKVLPVEP